ncbi:hypothetical protein VP01_133g1 [Puccinia sorghi]|uniref:Uncharacterized protein n=1 Tax=Puccinia sorghi TaxID=27349 RepID=A0A0L6VMV9_9BASI|nr:hypothetical protein VP01_133g1 [Puccinia sorghi]
MHGAAYNLVHLIILKKKGLTIFKIQYFLLLLSLYTPLIHRAIYSSVKDETFERTYCFCTLKLSLRIGSLIEFSHVVKGSYGKLFHKFLGGRALSCDESVDKVVWKGSKGVPVNLINSQGIFLGIISCTYGSTPDFQKSLRIFRGQNWWCGWWYVDVIFEKNQAVLIKICETLMGVTWRPLMKSEIRKADQCSMSYLLKIRAFEILVQMKLLDFCPLSIPGMGYMNKSTGLNISTLFKTVDKIFKHVNHLSISSQKTTQPILLLEFSRNMAPKIKSNQKTSTSKKYTTMPKKATPNFKKSTPQRQAIPQRSKKNRERQLPSLQKKTCSTACS